MYLGVKTKHLPSTQLVRSASDTPWQGKAKPPLRFLQLGVLLPSAPLVRL